MPRNTTAGPLPRITGSVRIDLAGTARQIRARAFDLERLWPGTAVQIDVGTLEPWDTDVHDLVHVVANSTHARALAVDVIGEPRAVATWVNALRSALNAHTVAATVGGDAS